MLHFQICIKADNALAPPAGMFFIVPCVEHFIKVDLRTMSFDVPPQEILTKDSVTVAVDAVVYYRIFKPMTSVIKVTTRLYTHVSMTLNQCCGCSQC